MLFTPSFKLNIIHESEFNDKMSTVDAELLKYEQNGYFKSFDNSNIYYEYYKAVDSKASIVIVHGYTEFSKKYHELCWYFLEMGFNVFIYDQRGHGKSQRQVENIRITHVNDFNDYVKDLSCYIDDIVIPNSDNKPVFIFSHSMGGAVAALYLSICGEKVQKAVLSAPMVYPVSGVHLPHKVLRALVSGEARKYGWEAKFKFSGEFNPDDKFEKSSDLSENRFKYNMNTRIKHEEYQNSSSSNRWNFEVLGVVDKLLNRRTVKSILAKIVIISAGADTVVSVKHQKALAKLLKCDYIVLENAKHSLYTAKPEELYKYIKILIDFYTNTI